MRKLVILGVAVLAIAGPQPAVLAQEGGATLETYQELVTRAARDFREQRFAAARRAFLAAYDIHPEPILLYNVAGTLRHEGKYREAITFYQRFLDLAPRDHARREAALRYVQELDDALADASPGDTDGFPDGEGPGASGTDQVTDHRRVGRTKRLSGIGFAVAGGLLFGVAIQQQRKASSIVDELAALPAGTPWSQELDDRYADSQSTKRRALILAVAGTAATVGGVVLYVLGERQRRAASRRRSTEGRVSFYPELVRGGLGVGLAMDF